MSPDRSPAPIFDAHSDLLLELVHAEEHAQEDDPLGQRWLDPLRRGGVALQVCAVYVEPDLAPAAALRRALRLVHGFRRAVEGNPDLVVPVERVADLDRRGSRVGLLLAMEGAAWLGDDPWLVDLAAALGVRMVGLTWNERNAFAAGCDHDDGLTALGGELLRRIVARGMIVDLAHASRRTFWDVLERAPEAQVLVSHAACRVLYDHPRNLADDQLRAIAERGGVLGLMPHPLVLGPERPDLEGVVDHIDHAMAVMGPRHVALGGDFLRQIARALGQSEAVDENGMPMDAAVDGLAGPEDYPALVATLERRGYARPVIDGVLRGNLERLLRAGLPR